MHMRDRQSLPPVSRRWPGLQHDRPRLPPRSPLRSAWMSSHARCCAAQRDRSRDQPRVRITRRAWRAPFSACVATSTSSPTLVRLTARTRSRRAPAAQAPARGTRERAPRRPPRCSPSPRSAVKRATPLRHRRARIRSGSMRSPETSRSGQLAMVSRRRRTPPRRVAWARKRRWVSRRWLGAPRLRPRARRACAPRPCRSSTQCRQRPTTPPSTVPARRHRRRTAASTARSTCSAQAASVRRGS